MFFVTVLFLSSRQESVCLAEGSSKMSVHDFDFLSALWPQNDVLQDLKRIQIFTAFWIGAV
jgi:hypothetical protein